jgi:hypothetical protein
MIRKKSLSNTYIHSITQSHSEIDSPLKAPKNISVSSVQSPLQIQYGSTKAIRSYSPLPSIARLPHKLTRKVPSELEIGSTDNSGSANHQS